MKKNSGKWYYREYAAALPMEADMLQTWQIAAQRVTSQLEQRSGSEVRWTGRGVKVLLQLVRVADTCIKQKGGETVLELIARLKVQYTII
jgi:hypothetical protein